MKVTADAVQAANKLAEAGELNPFELAGIPEGQYEQIGPNESAVILPFRDPHGGTASVEMFHDVANVKQIKVGKDEGGDDEIVEVETFEDVETEEHEETGAVMPASAGGTGMTPESDFAETADSGGDDDYYGEWNDAALIGPEPEGYVDFLHKDATFLIGEMWGAKDRRNTQDGDWKAVTMSWGNWIEGAPGNKNQPAFGFSRHPEGKYKEGASIVLGSSIEGARKANAMDEMFALGLDIDSGAQLPDVEAKIRELDLLALIYTSHSHGKSGLEIKRDEVMRKLGISEEPTLPQVQEFLRMHSKSRYEESFIAQVRIVDPKKQTKEGVKIELSTPPLDKFRVILPLAEAVKLIDLAPTQQAALEVWEDKITGAAWEMLGVYFDTSCTDPSRLFYTARHAKGAEWDCSIIRGAPLRFEDVPTYKKHQYTKHRSKLNAFEMAGDGLEEGRAPAAFTPSGKDLNDWHHHAKDRFQIATLLEDLCQDKIRVAGGEAQGHVHLECPFEHEHSKEGGTGTMAIDAIDAQTEYWTVFCKHDSCQGRHKLQFLEEMLAQGWFEEDVLFDEDGLYLLPPGEEVAAYAARADFLATAEAFDKNTTDKAVVALFAEMLATGADETTSAMVEDAVVEAVGLKKRGKGSTQKLWDKAKETCAEMEAAQRARAKEAMEMPDLVVKDAATVETVNEAAANIKWPIDVVYRDGWFGTIIGFGVDAKFLKTVRAFEPVYCADGGTAKDRTNEITIRYPHRSNQIGIVESTYSLGDTYVDSGALLKRLVNEGLETHPSADTSHVLTLLRSVRAREAVLVDRAGWTADKLTWVSPTGEVVTEQERTFILPMGLRVSAEKAGTLDLWVKNVDIALRGRNAKHFLPGFLLGGAGMIVDLLDEQMSLIVTNEGEANRGKTTSLYAAASWHAITSATQGLVGPADTTETALEGLAVRSHGSVLILDEEGTANTDPAKQQAMILRMAGGMGRARGKADGKLRDVVTWSTALGTSTESGFVQRLEQSTDPKDKVRTGAVSRVISVNFDNAPVLDKAGDKAELDAYAVLAGVSNSESIQRAYGWAGIILARKMLDLGVEGVKGHVDALEAEWGKGRSGPQRRVLRAMAILGAVANIAKEAELIADDINTDKMLAELLDDTIAQRERHLNTATQSLDRLKAGIVKAVNSGEIVCTKNGQKLMVRETLGYFKYAGDANRNNDSDEALAERTYIIPVDRLGKLGVQTNPETLADRLHEAGALIQAIKDKKANRMSQFHNYIPTEGRGKNIQIPGAWVHGLGDWAVESGADAETPEDDE